MKILIFLLLCYFQSNCALKPSPGCEKTQPSEPKPGQFKTVYFNYTDYRLGVIERNYILQVPLHYSHRHPTPLVLDMHGFQGDAYNQMSKLRYFLHSFLQSTFHFNLFQLIPLGKVLDWKITFF